MKVEVDPPEQEEMVLVEVAVGQPVVSQKEEAAVTVEVRPHRPRLKDE